MLGLPAVAPAQGIKPSGAGLPDAWRVSGVPRGQSEPIAKLPASLGGNTGSVELGETVRNLVCERTVGPVGA